MDTGIVILNNFIEEYNSFKAGTWMQPLVAILLAKPCKL